MRRVVLFKKKADADLQAFTSALGHLQTLDKRMAEMNTWWLEINPGPEGMWDAALVADFTDVDSLHRYENHEQHIQAATAVAAVSDFAVFDSRD